MQNCKIDLEVPKVAYPIVGLLITLFFVACSGSGPSAVEGQLTPSFTDLFATTTELPSNNVNVVVRHASFPVGFITPEHTHEGPGPRYVLSGKVEVVEGGETQTYGAGEVFWETGSSMTAENIGDGELLVLIVELLPSE